MQTLIAYATLISAILGALVSIVTLYQLRLFIGKEASRRLKDLKDKI